MSEKRRWWFERDHFKDAEKQVRPLAARLTWCPPNVLTLIGLLLAAPMAYALIQGDLVVGAILFSLSLITDLFDGPVARLQQERMTDGQRTAESMKFFLFRKGQTRFGTVFDPVVDKVRYFAALFPLWDRLFHPLIWTGLAFAVALTLIRIRQVRKAVAWLVSLFASMRAPRETEVSDKTPGSNKLGKNKVHVEAALIYALILLPHDPVSIVLQHALLAVATIGGLASLTGQVVTAYEESKAPA